MKVFVAFSLHRRPLLLSMLWIFALAMLPVGNAHHTWAQTANLPAVRYVAAENIIYIGDDYSDPTFAAFPSHPDAPKSPITIPELRAALETLVDNANALLENQGSGVWLLKADVVVKPTARLEATNATIAWLRLDSTPDRFPAYTRLTATGGHLLIQGIKVTSWDTSAGDVDTEYLDGRSYLLAQLGGRMDIIDAEVAYLGWSDGEPSGLAWRKRSDTSRPETGATGKILRSNIHHNYFGQYSYEAYGMQVLHNEFHHNVLYGFDPHDYSMKFEVAYNKVYNNGKHGIIFSRHCSENWIHHNEVYSNAEHGIMLDRDSQGKISDNLVYDNRDGIAIFQSSDNIIQNNVLRDNERGIRINATYNAQDQYDGVSTNNTVIGNTIQNNSEYGIYLYQRADGNRIVGNEITGNARIGIYIKTGANTIADNQLRTNGHGITIVGSESYSIPDPPPAGAPTPTLPKGQPGAKNWIYHNTIADNNTTGIQIKRGRDNVIGPKRIDLQPDAMNLIVTNGTHGIFITDGSTGNSVIGNTIHGNGNDGVQVRGTDSIENEISRNSITANGQQGIALKDDGNNAIAAPAITSDRGVNPVSGTADPGVTIEIYRDANGQGQVYQGSTTVDNAGQWSFTLPAGDTPQQEGAVTAIAIDNKGNTSAFAGGTSGDIVYELGFDTHKNAPAPILSIYIKNKSTTATTLTLPDIQRAVQTLTTTQLLEDQGNGVWQLNASLFIRSNVVLELTSDTVTWLKLRSQGKTIALAAEEEAYNYRSFVTIRTHDGTIVIDGVKITSWDPNEQTYDTDISNGRSYILAKYDARLDIKNAELSYLGFADGESYGVAWRDINDADKPDELRTRVTGEILNSTFSYNYYGIYTYQASNMVFRGNTFHHNIGYGFDPHDYSHHFVVEDNEAYENGNHGFIISRGCHNFVFRRNKSYHNRYSFSDKDYRAHGFMIDPGSPNSRYPQVPSVDNLLEQNEAWGNDGYGLRIVGSNANTIRENKFSDNLQGITVEQGSTNNRLEQNTITGSQLYGIYLIGGSDQNSITNNTISGSGKHGIYLKTGRNTISGNSVVKNGAVVDGTPTGAGIALLRESTTAAALEDLRVPGTGVSLAAIAPDLLGDPALASAVEGNIISQNTIAGNAGHGLELKSAINTMVEDNVVENNGTSGAYLASGAQRNILKHNILIDNQEYGIKANGKDVLGNTWTENQVYDNGRGGIVVTSNANNGIRPPAIFQQGHVITGTTTPQAIVEIFSDKSGQGRYFEGRTTAGTDGTFSFTASHSWNARHINATATDSAGNTSAFTYNVGKLPGGNTTTGPGLQIYLPFITR